MIACRSCGAPTASSDGICRDCADAMRAERSEALSALCRVHRVRYVEDLPVSALQEMQAEWGGADGPQLLPVNPPGRRRLCACLTDDCAWFDRERGVCAMVAIAREIRDRGRRR